jgi:hypothetical protein
MRPLELIFIKTNCDSNSENEENFKASALFLYQNLNLDAIVSWVPTGT